MPSNGARLHIAIQKSGRLSRYSRELLREAGLRIQSGKNDLTARVDNFPIDLMLVRDDDIPTFVADGVCEFGIVGRNVLEEFALGRKEERFDVIAPLGFGHCALKLAAPRGADYDGAQCLAGQRIATSYPRLLGAWLERQGIEARVVRMSGAVELAPRLGIAGFVCDLVSTGSTLEANNLAPVETVLESEAVLVRTRMPIDEAKQRAADNLLKRIDGVLATQGSKYIMMNAPEDALAEITAILPGVEAPSVIPLAGRPGHFALHAVCQETVFWETLHDLKQAGASAILVLPIEKMMQ
ncbi:MAG: ATP phosphoribosyltransferase [Sphingomonadales bacterium]|nr:ATP phosphoribosyltransferase [Sphingomonadales bacterium]